MDFVVNPDLPHWKRPHVFIVGYKPLKTGRKQELLSTLGSKPQKNIRNRGVTDFIQKSGNYCQRQPSMNINSVSYMRNVFMPPHQNVELKIHAALMTSGASSCMLRVFRRQAPGSE